MEQVINNNGFIAYETRTFHKKSQRLIETANSIIAEYREGGYDLTLRQLFYQFVSKGIIKNTEKEYKKLGVLISNARLAGLISWHAIVDRTRISRSNSHFDDPGDILSAAAKQYRIDTRTNQDVYLEIWIEKEALLGVIEPTCRELDVRCLACKGYLSQSAMWEAAQRIIDANDAGQKAVVLYFGDHDPSGLDMGRYIHERLRLFGADVQVDRIALNMDQIEQYNPPPNPAKENDKRYAAYVAEYGKKCWELDALEPSVITELIEEAVAKYTDEDRRQELIDLQAEQKKSLACISEHWQTLDAGNGPAEVRP
mgnify:CR=1 FL=1